MNTDNPFEQMANISKAHAYDIVIVPYIKGETNKITIPGNKNKKK